MELFNRRKVLAGIVMTENLNENSAKVIAITTGSRIFNGRSNINDNTIIYDSHAEILSRRCLIKFLYDQLELFFKSCKFFFLCLLNYLFFFQFINIINHLIFTHHII